MARLNDKQVETLIGQVLRTGMLIAVTVTLLGMGLYLWHYPSMQVNYRTFNPASGRLLDLSELIPNVLHGNPVALIQFGILLLIATPVARVAFLVGAFALERDRLYVIVSSLVLAILVCSLIFLG